MFKTNGFNSCTFKYVQGLLNIKLQMGKRICGIFFELIYKIPLVLKWINNNEELKIKEIGLQGFFASLTCPNSYYFFKIENE